MEKSQKLLFFSFWFFFPSVLTGKQCVEGSSHHHHHHHHLRSVYGFQPTKLFVFGDSYGDTGNTGKSISNSWKIPYGITFPGKPAGRFSSGRILPDYLAKFLGLKSPIPYAWRKFASKDRLHYGMNFAYGGSGVFDTLASYPNMTTQIDFFQNLINESSSSVYTKKDLQSSLALVSLAGNDYSAYLARNGSYQNLTSFIADVVNQLALNLKRIHSIGVRKVVVTSLQPLGCLPQGTVTNSYKQCNDTQNVAATYHNILLEEAVAKLNNDTNDSAFVILDLYNSFMSVLDNPGTEGFQTPLKPCCMGIGNYFCSDVDQKGTNMYTICDNPESTFFWDLVHPTQAGWREVFLNLKSGLNNSTS